MAESRRSELHKLIFITFLIGCTQKPLTESPSSPPAKLDQVKADLDARLHQAQSWPDGWPSRTDCDALLWAGLARAGGVPVNLDLAEYDEPGKWNRRPKPACWPGPDSKSTLSRDMVLGRFWAAWIAQDWEPLDRFAARTIEKKWVIGEPYPDAIGDVFMNENLMGLMARMLCSGYGHCLKEKDLGWQNAQSDKDYVQHNTVLFILLNQRSLSQKLGSFAQQSELPQLGAKDYDVLKWHAEKQPNDPLFQFVFHVYSDGDLGPVADLLVDPNFRCPSYVRGSENYCDVYRIFVDSLLISKYL